MSVEHRADFVGDFVFQPFWAFDRIIEEAIDLIISGKIIDYVYDEESKLIRGK